MPTSRRTFLGATAATAFYLQGAPLANFSPQEAAILEAVCEQMLPSDDLPGAREAGIVYFIDKQLSGQYKRYASAYRSGLAGLSKASFLQLSFEERTKFLDAAEAGKSPDVPKSFVTMVADHTMQGFFGDPKQGGNTGSVSWKMIGIEGGHSH